MFLNFFSYFRSFGEIATYTITFETNTHIPGHLLEVPNDPELYSNETLGKCQSIIKEYEHFKNRAKKETAQLWVPYLDLVKNQNFANIAVQSNYFDFGILTLIFAWKYMIPFFLVLNKISHARYGSFYAESIGNIEKFYLNLKPLLETKGFSVQGQDCYAIRTSIDQRGEQTTNQDAKTSGEITSFKKYVLKWCLNRSEQASNTRALLDLCGVGVANDQYKPCRPSQVILSENLVGSTMNVLINEYLNSFDESVGPKYLFNLSS